MLFIIELFVHGVPGLKCSGVRPWTLTHMLPYYFDSPKAPQGFLGLQKVKAPLGLRNAFQAGSAMKSVHVNC